MTNVVHAIDIKTEKQERGEYRQLIMEGDNFKIVIDNNGDIDWETTDAYDWKNVDDKDITKRPCGRFKMAMSPKTRAMQA